MSKPARLSALTRSIAERAVCRLDLRQESRLNAYFDQIEQASPKQPSKSRVALALDVRGKPWALVAAATLVSTGQGSSYARLYLRLLEECKQRPGSAEDAMQAAAEISTLFKEIPMRLCPLVGIPRTINVLTELDKVKPDVKVLGRVKYAPRSVEEGSKILRQRGRQRFEKIYGAFTDRVLQQLGRIYPDFDQFILTVPYGLHLGHPGPVPSKGSTGPAAQVLSEDNIGACTSILVLSALVAQGQAGKQVESHAHGCLNVGLDPEWICQMATEMTAIINSGASIPARL